MIITATGQSSGDFFEMEIIDTSGHAHGGMLPEGIVLEPVAAPPVPASSGARTTTQDVSGFCLDFAKEVPAPGTRYRIAPRAAQAQASTMRNVLAASRQLAMRNLPHSDGTTGYLNFIRQYAVWAKRENWDIKKFGESFVERTKKNVLSMKANWTDAMEQGVRAAVVRLRLISNR